MGKVSVVNFFKDKNVFLTGGTGFMGKVLIEKLLYSCSDVKKIYVLIRPKKGKTPKQRVDEIISLALFDRIRNENLSVLEKIIPVFGDVSETNLGLNEEQMKELIQETNVIFHIAANLKMKGDLKDAIKMNVTGTNYIIEMAKQMSGLVSFVHVSTAFCNIDQEVAEEKVYDFPHKPKDIIQCAEWMDENLMNAMIGPLIGPPENIYVYTKRLAEILVRDEFNNLPICIARPSIVIPSLKEPVAGWTDSITGITGLFVGGGKGIIRTALYKPGSQAEVIPVDLAINGLLCVAAVNGSCEEKPAEIPVFHLTNSKKLIITWEEACDIMYEVNKRIPVEPGLWIPTKNKTTSPIVFKIEAFLYHFLPALFIDFLLFIFMQKRFMMRVYRKVSDGLGVLTFFALRNWIFTNEKYLQLYDKLIESEHEKFVFDLSVLKLSEVPAYLENSSLGLRQYFLKEPISSIPKSRRKYKIMWTIDKIVKGFVLLFLLRFVLKIFSMLY
jgi:fatty acyl-CoA reductase